MSLLVLKLFADLCSSNMQCWTVSMNATKIYVRPLSSQVMFMFLVILTILSFSEKTTKIRVMYDLQVTLNNTFMGTFLFSAF